MKLKNETYTGQQAITITNTDLKRLLHLVCDIEVIQEFVGKCTAAADIFSEALRYGETCPTDEEIYPDMADIISKYGYKAKEAVTQLKKDYDELHDRIMKRGVDT